MINPETVTPSSLPSVRLSNRKRLPQRPGIYFAIDSQGIVQYIGKSENIYARWKNHHRTGQLEHFDSVKIAYLEFSNLEMLHELERALISWFKPPLNGSKVFSPEHSGPMPITPKKKAQGRPLKPHKVICIKLDSRLVPFTENSLDGATDTIEMGLRIIQYLAKQAINEDKYAIDLLAKFGVEAKATESGPIVVYRPGVKEAFWVS